MLKDPLGRVPSWVGEDANVRYHELPHGRVYTDIQISDPSSSTVREWDYDVSILQPSPLAKPSTSACILLMWAQLELDHTLKPGKEAGSTVKFSTARPPTA
jgi:hypothetical protein